MASSCVVGFLGCERNCDFRMFYDVPKCFVEAKNAKNMFLFKAFWVVPFIGIFLTLALPKGSFVREKKHVSPFFQG